MSSVEVCGSRWVVTPYASCARNCDTWLRCTPQATHGVGMDVDQAGEDGLARHVADLGVVGDGDAAGGAHGGDAVALDDDVTADDDLFAAHGDQAGAGEGDGALRFVLFEGDVDVVAGGGVDGSVVLVAVLV